MAWEADIIKGGNVRMTTGYASETVTASYVMAYAGYSTLSPTTAGAGFGFGIKGANATNSVVVGLVFSHAPASKATYGIGEIVPIFQRGVFARAACWATCTVGWLAIPCASKVGILSDGGGEGTDALFHPGLCGVFLETVESTVTTSACVWMNTWA